VTLIAKQRIDVDVAIIGSGFAGSLMALALRSRGQRVALIERGRHPRFAIGESSTPLANLLIEELADKYDLPRLRPFSKWGTWQRAYPDVAAGLKRGFTFLFHTPPRTFTDTPSHHNQLMVAASPHDAIADTHWYRPDFDHWLAREAETAGAVFLDETAIDVPRRHGDVVSLDATRAGRSLNITASFVVDASGPRGFLHRALSLDESPLRWLPATCGLYTHFADVDRWDHVVPSATPPPYPPDDAALHHVMPGGWIWVLRFNNGLTSAGAAMTRPLADTIGASEGAGAWDRLLATIPSVQAQFSNARAVLPFVHAPTLAFRSSRISGPWWAQLPSAAGVIDPLLSTGFPLTLLGIHRLLSVLEDTRPGEIRERALREYEEVTRRELDVTEMLVAALYGSMSDPPLFKSLARLYFAAASFSEAARRLGRPELAPGFLLEDHPRFGMELRACAAAATGVPRCSGRAPLLDRIARAIEPFDIAGLLDPSRHDWYPVLAADLIANATRLSATADEIAALLARSGFDERGAMVDSGAGGNAAAPVTPDPARRATSP
jgi:tetracycline 7-halogenase / FADH2 O2-dependent halogenase